jgi:8-oxo-dGTP pyrophosphatase MutT (NUDIX family)
MTLSKDSNRLSPAPPPLLHPRPDGRGQPILIKRPHHPGPEAYWHLANQIATFLPNGPVPVALNGIPFSSWRDAPSNHRDWSQVSGQKPDLAEPPFDSQGKEPAAGLIIVETDGRVWIVCPTNGFAGCLASFPKGRADEGLSLQVTAIKETYEETGLRVAITGLLGDFPGAITMARYYRGRRVSGSPADMGWESQAVLLVPRDRLSDLVNLPRDQEIARLIDG